MHKSTTLLRTPRILIQWDAVDTSPDLAAGQNVVKTFEMAIRTTRTESEKVFCCWIYFHLRSKTFFQPSYRVRESPPSSLPIDPPLLLSPLLRLFAAPIVAIPVLGTCQTAACIGLRLCFRPHRTQHAVRRCGLLIHAWWSVCQSVARASCVCVVRQRLNRSTSDAGALCRVTLTQRRRAPCCRAELDPRVPALLR